MTNQLAMKQFKVRVLVVPPNYEIIAGVNTVHYETITITGYTLKDAKKRAGIK